MFMFLPRSLGSLAKWAVSAGRYLPAVRLRQLDGGLFDAAATDGRCVVIVQGTVKKPEILEIPEQYNITDNVEALIHPDQWAEFFKVDGDDCLPNVALATIQPAAPGKPAQILGLGNRTLRVTEELEGRFPPVDQIIPPGPPPLKFTVDGRRLGALLDLAKRLGIDSVTLAFYDFNTDSRSVPIGIYGTDADHTVTMDALLVPLYTPEEQQQNVRRKELAKKLQQEEEPYELTVEGEPPATAPQGKAKKGKQKAAKK